jgi:endonuclease/exonuclease/phosphatase family metal-dependent hydrolase
MKGSRMLRILLLSVNLLMILSLLISDIAPYISPTQSLMPAFFGLAFLPLLVINLLFGLFWLIMRPQYLVFAGIGILLSIPNISRHFQLFNAPNSDSPEFLVLSFNVRLFDLYNWSNNKQTRDQILDYIKSTEADIICLQEYFRSDDLRYFNTMDPLVEIQKAKNIHEHFTALMHGGTHKFGIVTISSFPIVNRGRVPLDTSGHNIAIYTDLKIKNDTIRVFNIHLASIHISGLEKDINDHLDQNEQKKQWTDLKTLIRKLASGFKKRSLQADAISEYIAHSPYPVIVCGDLNDTPGSYAYQRLNNSLQDAFRESGGGLGSTYIGFFPSLRIDYMLFSPGIENAFFQTENIKLSDHKPLIGGFRLSE